MGLDDEQAIRKRAEWMRSLVARGMQQPTVRDAALKLQSQADTPYGQLEALHIFVRDGISYKHDPAGTDLYRDASLTLRLGYGDCDCKAILFCSLAKIMGYRCGFLYVAQGYSYIHVLPFAYMPSGQKVYYEVTIQKPFNWRPPSSKSYEIVV